MAHQLHRPLPDPAISLRDARDFILGGVLARKAFGCSVSGTMLLIHDLLEAIWRLVQTCHLPEFTDHGLPHLCSLVDRIGRWEMPSESSREPTAILVGSLTADEAAILLLATLIHDIGMLSQNALDLPQDTNDIKHKGQWSDVATWVRQTHVDRLDRLTKRVLRPYGHRAVIESEIFSTAVDVAKSHQKWPWEWNGAWTENQRMRGLAAILAVADLLDEDSARCDTATLIEHREGNEVNRAHWLRHALTANRILVTRGRIRVEMTRFPETSDVLRPVYSAIRNHFRLVTLYERDLAGIRAPITNIDLLPSTGAPDLIADDLKMWKIVAGFATEHALCFQLLRTFMHPVLKDFRKCDSVMLDKLRIASLEDVDLTLLHNCEGHGEPRTGIETTFAALQLE